MSGKKISNAGSGLAERLRDDEDDHRRDDGGVREPFQLLPLDRPGSPEPDESGRPRPRSSTKIWTEVSGCRPPSAARRAVTGSAARGSWSEKLTSEMAEVTISAAPPTTATHSTGRHRREGGRPSGNSSRVTKNSEPGDPQQHGEGPADPRRAGQLGPRRAARRRPCASTRDRAYRRRGQEQPAQAVPGPRRDQRADHRERERRRV